MVKETKAKQHSLNCKFINPGHNTTVNILWQTLNQTAIWNFLTYEGQPKSSSKCGIVL